MNLLKGLLIGLIVGFPASPLGAIAISEMLEGKIKKGFLKGIGSTIVNGLYGIVVTFGLGYVSSVLLKEQQPIKIGGAVLTIILGIFILLQRKKETKMKEIPESLSNGASILTGFFLSITNPAKIAIFTSLIALFGPAGENIIWASWILVAGIVLATFFWWVLFALGAKRFIKKNPTASPNLKILFASLVLILGVIMLITAIFQG